MNSYRENNSGSMLNSTTSSSKRGKTKEKDKGKKLVLAGLTKTKNQKRSSTSPGSSIQQTNQSGSSTQQTSQTLKQTKEDYAFPIQTLLAFQDQGLTKLPKKSWAKIASDNDEDEDYPLTLMIQNLTKQVTKEGSSKQTKSNQISTKKISKPISGQRKIHASHLNRT